MMTCYATILARAGGSLPPRAGAGAGAGRRGGGSLLLPAATHFPNRTGGGAMLLATAAPRPAKKTWHETQFNVTAHEVMVWCIHDTLDLLKKIPPPPLGEHNLQELVADYERLSKRAETESIEIYAGALTLLNLHLRTRESYAIVVKGYRGGLEGVVDLHKIVKEATVDRLLRSFCIKKENLPEDPLEHRLSAAMMQATDVMKNVMGNYGRKLKRIQRRLGFEVV